MYRLTSLGTRDASGLAEPQWQAFVQALRDLGWMEGRNLAIEYYSAENNVDRLPALAADMARRRPDIIVTGGTQDTVAAKNATATIPIVMWTTQDLVKQGFVVSMARPGANITGLADIPTLSRKQVELTKELLPGASRVAVLRNPAGSQAVHHTSEAEQAARALGLQLRIVDVQTPRELPGALVAATQNRPHVLVMSADWLFLAERARVAEFALKHRLPSIYVRREFVDAGGLIAYGSSRIEVARRQAAYVDKILKGAKPADLPIEQPTKFELVINLKTAKALGLTIRQHCCCVRIRWSSSRPSQFGVGGNPVLERVRVVTHERSAVRGTWDRAAGRAALRFFRLTTRRDVRQIRRTPRASLDLYAPARRSRCADPPTGFAITSARQWFFSSGRRLASGHAGDNDPTHIHACVGNTSRIVRDVGVNGTCIANPPQVAETAKHWNITGPAGAQGPQGPAGPVNAYIANSNSHVIEGDWQELIGLSDIPGGYYMVWTVIYAHNDNDEFPVVCNLFINNDPVSDPNGADSGLPLTVFSTGADGYGVIATVKTTTCRARVT